MLASFKYSKSELGNGERKMNQNWFEKIRKLGILNKIEILVNKR